MHWALVSHPAQLLPNGRLLLPPLAVAESCVATAVEQGWIVIARDSDVELVPDAPLLSNPRRVPDPLPLNGAEA